jgi:hypothetical protein
MLTNLIFRLECTLTPAGVQTGSTPMTGTQRTSAVGLGSISRVSEGEMTWNWEKRFCWFELCVGLSLFLLLFLMCKMTQLFLWLIHCKQIDLLVTYLYWINVQRDWINVWLITILQLETTSDYVNVQGK